MKTNKHSAFIKLMDYLRVIGLICLIGSMEPLANMLFK